MSETDPSAHEEIGSVTHVGDLPPNVELQAVPWKDETDSKTLVWSHDCRREGAEWWRPSVPLPVNRPNRIGWTVEQEDPLTVSPSILCRSCGVHGFWRDGQWVPA